MKISVSVSLSLSFSLSPSYSRELETVMADAILVEEAIEIIVLRVRGRDRVRANRETRSLVVYPLEERR
jgi:hypothetical protein